MTGDKIEAMSDDRVRDEQFLRQSEREERRMWMDLFMLLPKFVIYFVKFLFHLIVPKRMKDVRGQLALITGGANGIGREIGLNLARQGCNIVILDIDLPMATKTAKELEMMGVKAKAYKADVSKSTDIDALKDKIKQEMGVVDILINNAGVFFCKSPEEETAENLQRMININLMSNFWTCRAFLQDMIDQKRGHILSISSFAGLVGLPTSICYTASKFGVRGFVEGLAMDLHFRGLSDCIRTTTVFPYFVDTNPGIKVHVVDKCAHKVMYDPKVIGKEIVEGLLRNEEVITFPSFCFYGCYLMSFPLGLKRLGVNIMSKVGEKSF
ncbi:uncharacterized oxidoreductase YoxD-like [Culicoides brevitarsis]|uniref:uncharacterized oxidoreductase YoxD-like n=1 Tax=Culicoides brevitarsis TaxID=469753 RepID=UPI00307B3BD5